MTRTVCWFSAGAASAVATKLTLADTDGEVVVAYTDPGSEHPDNARFINDCEAWFDHPVIRLRSERYRDTWQVWAERRFLVGPEGALCTTEMKKKLRQSFQRDDDVQVFGYTVEEQHRADLFRKNNIEVELRTPLIEHGLNKADCLALVQRAGLTLPSMYLLGYRNNNCVGCPKGGMGYWNKIRRDFPDTFLRMALLERDLDATCVREEIPDQPGRKTRPVFLDQLDPARGNASDEPDIDCSLLCAMAEGAL